MPAPVNKEPGEWAFAFPGGGTDLVRVLAQTRPELFEPLPAWLTKTTPADRPAAALEVDSEPVPGSRGGSADTHAAQVPAGRRLLGLAEAVAYLVAYREATNEWPFRGTYTRCAERLPETEHFADHCWSVGPFNVFLGVSPRGRVAIRFVGDAGCSCDCDVLLTCRTG